MAAMVMVCGSVVSAQDYAQPIDMEPMQSSSNFGKLRSTRFHSGIDIRTGGVEGKKVFAVESGEIYRIGWKPYGYGKVVYVMHPDGKISVYGHLSAFTAEIEEYVRTERLRRGCNDIDLFPPSGMFPVTKGEEIGLSGNSGYSFGPHLHFEIRDKGGERSLNVISRGYCKVRDGIRPEIFNVYYYLVDTLMGVPVHTLAVKARAVKSGDGQYTLDGSMVLPGDGYFCVETMDRKDGVSGSMATYRIVLSVNDRPHVEYLMDGFTFAQNHLAKIVSDYTLNRNTSNDVFRMALLNSEARVFYPTAIDNGLIRPANGVKRISIEVWDDSGNMSEVEFPVSYNPAVAESVKPVPSDAEAVDFRTNYSRVTGALKVTIPSGALYESLFYKQECTGRRPAESKGVAVLSDFYQVHDDSVPLHAPVILSFGVDVPDALRDKVVLARDAGNGRLAASTASYENGTVTGKVSVFGRWCVAADTAAPHISPTFADRADMRGQRRIGFRIGDNFSGVASYSAEVDGHWALMEYDVVNGVLYHYFDDASAGTDESHSIVLTVRDGAGNTAVCRRSYYR